MSHNGIWCHGPWLCECGDLLLPETRFRCRKKNSRNEIMRINAKCRCWRFTPWICKSNETLWKLRCDQMSTGKNKKILRSLLLLPTAWASIIPIVQVNEGLCTWSILKWAIHADTSQQRIDHTKRISIQFSHDYGDAQRAQNIEPAITWR